METPSSSLPTPPEPTTPADSAGPTQSPTASRRWWQSFRAGTPQQWVVAGAKAVASIIPGIGPIAVTFIQEALGIVVSNDQADRVDGMLTHLKEFIEGGQQEPAFGVALVEREAFRDALVNGIDMARTARSDRRRRNIAQMLYHELTEQNVHAMNARRFRETLARIDDAEFIILSCYAHKTFQFLGGYGRSQQISSLHRDIIAEPPAIIGNDLLFELNAMHQHRIANLHQHGLLERDERGSLKATRFGGLLVRWCDAGEQFDSEAPDADPYPEVKLR